MKNVFATILVSVVIISFFVVPVVVFAQEEEGGYTLLEPIEGFITQTEAGNLRDFLQSAFRWGVAIATALAVIMVAIGGIRYMTTGSIGGKAEGRDYIRDAILGLILALSTVIILNAINPQLTQFDLIDTLERIAEQVGKQAPEGPTELPPPPEESCSGCAFFKDVAPEITIKSTACSASECQAHTDLVGRLRNVWRLLEIENIDWRVTEAWPPTITHQNPCHEQGTCVDANISGLTVSKSSADRISTFVEKTSANGLTACYEVDTQEDKDALVEFGAPEENIDVITAITAPHFSVYLGSRSCL